MRQKKLIEVGLGVVVVCLLFVVVLPGVFGQEEGFARGAGNDTMLYIPFVAKAPVVPFITRISVASDGTEANDFSNDVAISSDGRYVAFVSWATNLIEDDTNGSEDVFVHDLQTRETSRVSIASDGTEANEGSYVPSISADGRYVAFSSYASNLANGATHGWNEVYVHDRQTGETSRVSITSDGTEGNEGSYGPSISADGRYVAFNSYASNLVSDDTNGVTDIFVHDRQTGETSRVSIASDGTQMNDGSLSVSISADGRYVAFESWANNLVNGDTNETVDIFVHDRQTGETSRVSIASDGTQAYGESWSPSISADGHYVTFRSHASHLVSGDTNEAGDIFVHDQQTGETTLVSVSSGGTLGNRDSWYPTISADGRYIAFDSYANNLVSGDANDAWDIFVHDRQTGETRGVTLITDGPQANEGSYVPSVSADGRYVAFGSYATNLGSDDTNGFNDIFVHDRGE